MRNSSFSFVVFLLASFIVFSPIGVEASESDPDGDASGFRQTVREIFVPETELATIFEGLKDRVLMKRGEFDALLEKVRTSRSSRSTETVDTNRPPVETVLISSDYEIRIHEQRAVIEGVWELETLTEGLSVFSFALNRVSLLEAIAETETDGDRQPAAIGSAANDSNKLLVLEGPRRHRIRLRMTTPLEIDSTRRRLRFRLPQGSSGSLKLSVPGDVELKRGASILSRNVENGATRFELLPPVLDGEMELLMTLNSHRSGSYRTILARSVQFAEIAEHYQRLHATVSLGEWHQGIREISFDVPPGFDVTDVRSVFLDRWNVRKTENGPDTLDIRFREHSTGLTVLHLSAIRSDPKIGERWRFPVFVPRGTASDSSVLGLLVDTDLDLLDIKTEKRFPVDTMTLKDAIPETALDALPGSPSLRLALAWYAPQADGRITASFRRPKPESRLETTQTLTLSEREPALSFGGVLRPRTGRMFEIVLETPIGWKVTGSFDGDGKALEFRKNDDGKTVIRLPRGIGPNERFPFSFHALGSVDGWFGKKDEKSLQYPVFRVEGTGIETGTITVENRSEDDWNILPIQAERLVPSGSAFPDAAQNRGSPDRRSALAMQYDTTPYSLELRLEKIEPRVKARTFSFYRFEPKLLRVRHEIEYVVEQAKTRQVSFVLSGGSSPTPNIQGLDGLTLKETFCEPVGSNDPDDKIRCALWTVRLTGPSGGTLRLAVDFEKPFDDLLSGKPETAVPLPDISAKNVSWQSAVIAVEGDGELDLSLPSDDGETAGSSILRPVDAGVLSTAIYRPGKRLLGVFAKSDGSVVVGVRKNTIRELPTSLIRRVSVTARLEDARPNAVLYVTRYDLQIAGGAVRTTFDGNSERLWSARLDGGVVRPQRVGNDVLIPIPPRRESDVRRLELIYRSKTSLDERTGFRAMSFPELRLAGKADAEPIPVMQTCWNVVPPDGYEIRRLGDLDVHPSPPQSALLKLVRCSLDWVSAAIQPAVLCQKKSATLSDSSEWIGGVSVLSVPTSPSLEEGKEMIDPFQSGIARQSAIATSLDALLDVDQAAVPLDFEQSDKTFFGGTGNDGKQRPKKQDTAPRGRRLQSVQPVSIVIADNAADNAVGGSFSAIGDRSVRTIPVQLSNSGAARNEERIAGLLVVLVGLSGFGWPRQRKSAFVFGLLTLGTVAVFLPGFDRLASVLNGVVDGSALVGSLYILHALGKGVFVSTFSDENHAKQKTSSAAILSGLLALCLGGASIHGGETERGVPEIVLPAEAMIVPYSPDAIASDKLPGSEDLLRPDQSILVPLEQYRRMLRLLQEEESLRERTKTIDLPITHAVSSVRYEATVVSENVDELSLSGTMSLDVYSENPILVPLLLENGVPVEASLDGRPASLQSRPDKHWTLRVEGVGRHEFSFRIQFRIRRQGGWHLVTGKLPAAAGSRVLLKLPEKTDDLLTDHPLDKRKWAVNRDRAVETALNPDGSFRWQWRSAVSEAGVDRSLEVESLVRMDLQEDGCWIRWTPTLHISRGKWEMLRLNLPNDYVLVEIAGDNVRGWSVAGDDSDGKAPRNETRIDIELLKPAEKIESFSVRLAKSLSAHPASDADSETRWSFPKLSIPEAGIHRGRIDLYRSARQNLRIVDSTGLTPTERSIDPPVPPSGHSAVFETASPLGLLPFQSYRFVSESYGMTILSQSVREEPSAVVETVLKISRQNLFVESKLRLNGSGRPFCTMIRLPDDFVLKNVEAPPGVSWNLHEDARNRPTGEPALKATEKILNLACGDGFSGDGEILLDGRIETGNSLLVETLPRFEIGSADSPTGWITPKTSIAVLTDPSLDVRAERLEGCRPVSPDRFFSWLVRPEQRELLRIALQSEIREKNPGFDGRLVLTARAPEIRCSTITNIRTTAEAVEETTLLDFYISRAGVRTLEFLLPGRAKDVGIEAPLLRHKTVQPLDPADPDSPLLVRLELQEEVMEQFRVLVRSDGRLCPETNYRVFVPVLRSAQATRQYIVMENDRRSPDEMVVDPAGLSNLRSLNRQQTEWTDLVSILGGNVSEAYGTLGGTEEAGGLSFRMRRRTAVRLAEARIDLAETRLILGENGAYRAEQTYRIDNKKEPYLDIALPAGASLWGVRLLDAAQWNRKRQGEQTEPGQPVKPCSMPSETASRYPEAKGKDESRLFRIPLIKTESGDLDYVIRLVYAGELPKPRNLARLDMPFITVLNVPIGQSLVRLHLPESYAYRFDGNLQRVNRDKERETMQQAESDYRRRQDDRLRQAVASGNPYAAGRAKFNLALRTLKQPDPIATSGRSDVISKEGAGRLSLRGDDPGAAVERGISDENDRSFEFAEEPAVELSGNTATIRQRFFDQTTKRSDDMVARKALRLTVNDRQISIDGKSSYSGSTVGQFDQGWLSKSNLSSAPPPAEPIKAEPMPQSTVVVPQPVESLQSTELNRGMFRRQGTSFGSPESGAAMNRPLIEPDIRQQTAAQRSVEVQGGKIILDNSTKTNGAAVYRNEYGRNDSVADTSGTGGWGGMGGALNIGGNALAISGKELESGLVGQGRIVIGLADSDPAGRNQPLPEDSASSRRLPEKKEEQRLAAPKPESPVSGLSTHSASLDIDLPFSGKSYLFTTPQGTLDLSARALGGRWSSRVLPLGLSLGGLFLLYVLYRLFLNIARRLMGGMFNRRTHRNLAVLTTLLGCLMGPLDLPAFALLMIVAGVLWTTLLRRGAFEKGEC